VEHREAPGAVGWLLLGHSVELCRCVAGRAGPLGNGCVAGAEMNYSDTGFALIAVALFATGVWVESNDDDQQIGRAGVWGLCVRCNRMVCFDASRQIRHTSMIEARSSTYQSWLFVISIFFKA
jgi:hypothetical protein